MMDRIMVMSGEDDGPRNTAAPPVVNMLATSSTDDAGGGSRTGSRPDRDRRLDFAAGFNSLSSAPAVVYSRSPCAGVPASRPGRAVE